MRRAARKDANHAGLVRDLVAFGCEVMDVSGCPCGADLVVWSRAVGWRVIEVKDGSKPPSARRLTEVEQARADSCRARGAQYDVVTCLADALEVLGLGAI